MWPDMARRNRNRPRGAALPVTPPSTQPDPDASAPSGAAAPPSVPGSSSDAAGTVTSASAPGSSSGAAAPEHPADNSALPRASAARLPGRAGCPAVAGNAAAPAPAGGTGAATAASAMPSTPLHTQGNRAGISAPAVGAPDSASVSTAATAAAEAWDSMAPAVAWAGLDQNTKDMLIWLHSNMPDPTEVHLGSLKVLVAELQAQGEHYKVRPLLCFCTFRHGAVCGLDADSTVAAALDVLKTDSLCGTVSLALLIWVLPRAAYSPTFGLAHPAFTTVIQLAARYLYWSKDPRQLTELAQQLPGGLGWGSTVVAPVPDEEAYARHCVMHAKAGDAAGQGHYALAKDMLTRCVAYFKTLGSHWLGTQRKIVAMIHLAGCVGHLEGWEAAERLYVQAKRTAQEELGRGNEATLAVTWVVCSTHLHIASNSVDNTRVTVC